MQQACVVSRRTCANLKMQACLNCAPIDQSQSRCVQVESSQSRVLTNDAGCVAASPEQNVPSRDQTVPVLVTLRNETNQIRRNRLQASQRAEMC